MLNTAAIVFILVVLVLYLGVFVYIVLDAMKPKKPLPRLVLKKWTQILTKEPILILIRWEIRLERITMRLSKLTKSATLVVYTEGKRICHTKKQERFIRYDFL